MQVKQISVLPDGFDALLQESLREGFGALKRLKENHLNGSNTFSLNGEALFAVSIEESLVGVCGLNRDPYAAEEDIGRVRHLYVRPEFRKKGVGRTLVQTVEKAARSHFSLLRLYTGSEKASTFYEILGYQRLKGDHVSHVKVLIPARKI